MTIEKQLETLREKASSFKDMDDCNSQAGEICKEALDNFEKELGK